MASTGTYRALWKDARDPRSLLVWKDARDPRSLLVRVYGAVDLTCAFVVGALSGAGGLVCSTRSALICVTCFANVAHAAVVRPATGPLDNALSVTRVPGGAGRVHRRLDAVLPRRRDEGGAVSRERDEADP